MEINLLHLAKMTFIFTVVEILILFVLGKVPMRRGSLSGALLYTFGEIMEIVYFNAFICIFLFFMIWMLIVPYFITLSPIIAFLIRVIMAFYLNLALIHLTGYLLWKIEDLLDEYRQRNESDILELKFEEDIIMDEKRLDELQQAICPCPIGCDCLGQKSKRPLPCGRKTVKTDEFAEMKAALSKVQQELRRNKKEDTNEE